jgi:4-amino-4-deoxy-L-arabinose transferase-like glycosyltransferase
MQGATQHPHTRAVHAAQVTSATDPLPHTTVTSAQPSPRRHSAPRTAAPRWSAPALVAIMILAAALYSWNLSGSSLNTFYSAAVLSGTESWKAWFFGSLDAGNFLTVDKPPLALMVMGLSCRVLGYGTWQMMAPMIGAALGTIWILHSSVKRVWGHAAATVAALVLALTPITVAINRDNNPDTLLVLLMVGGAALGLRAVTNGRLLPLLGSAVCFGLAFNTKLLAGYIALPAVFAVYLYAARPALAKRLVNLLLAAVVLAVSSFWWAVAVSLVPASDRPYIGGSTDGTAWNLIMGYDGFGRIFGGDDNMGGGGGAGGPGGFSGTAGIGRMFNDILGGQISWLLPFTALALIAGLILCGRTPRTDLTRAALVLWGGWTLLHFVTFSTAQGTMHPYYTTAMAPGIAALCAGGGAMLLRAFRTDRRWMWVLPAGLAATGIWAIVLLRRVPGWHTWLWPAVGVLTVAGIVGLLVFRNGRRVRLLAASVITAVVAAVAGPTAYAWSVPAGSSVDFMGGTNPTAGPSTRGFGGGTGGFGGDSGSGEMPRQGGGNAEAGGGFPGGGFRGGGGFPGGGAASGAPGGGAMPGGGQPGSGFPGGAGGESGAADRAGGMGGMGGGMGRMSGGSATELISYLEKHQDGATWLVAVADSQSASQLIVDSGRPVISMWGWTGTDKAMTVDKLKELVSKGELHYIQLGGRGMGGGGSEGSDSLSSEVTAWVQKHGTAVPESAYSKSSSSSSSGSSSGSSSKPASGSSSGSASGASASDASGASKASSTSTLYRLDPSDVS